MAFRICAKRPLKKLQALKNLLSFGKPIEVKRSTAPYIEQTGWHQTTSTSPREWQGYYRTRFGSYRGRITASTPPQFYIHKPPKGLKRAPLPQGLFYPDAWRLVFRSFQNHAP